MYRICIKKDFNKMLLFLMSFYCFICKLMAQDYNRSYKMICQYEMEYQPDSTNLIKKKALMGLLLNQDNSLFGDWNNLLTDTVLYNYYKTTAPNAHSPKGVISHRNFDIRYRIYKSSQNKIETLDQVRLITTPTYEYEEPKNLFSWKIFSDTTTISGYKCQKAACDFGNRHWVAWFSLQVPISDGPYKFCGLPGLIIQIEDATNSWKFTLTSLETKMFTYDFYNFASNDKILKLTKDRFFATLKNSYDNGFEMEQLNGITFMNGRDEEKKKYEDRARRENNWIEIYKKRKTK